MSQSSRGVVPKFGSFKPKAAPKVIPVDLEPTPRELNRLRQTSPSRERDQQKRKRRLSGDRHYSRHHAERKDHGSRDPKQELRKRSLSPNIAKDEFEESNLFIVDRTGDKKNVEYGGLHRYDIPAHYRYGNGRVLGTARAVRIDREGSTDKQIALRLLGRGHGEHSARPFTSKPKLADARGLRLILPASAPEVGAGEDDYIALHLSRKRKRGSQSPEPVVEAPDYRSIEGKAKSEPGPDDEDMEYTTASDDGEVDDIAHRAVREMNASLNRKAKADPQNVDAWLALIEHQANVVLPGYGASTFNSSQRRALADIRLSIYDRALKHVGKQGPGCDKLVLGRLNEGSTVWENAKVTTKWAEALKDNPSSISLWTKYLDLAQTDHINFRFEKCREAYIECFRMLHKTHTNASPETVARVCSAQIYVLARCASFVRDAGYDELAYAIWQIVFEYQFCKPPDLSSHDEVLESLEAFWESDVPRIGEEGAEGWKSFYSDPSNATRSSDIVPKESLSADFSIQSFAETESKAMDSFHLPATANDGADSNDPFRFVMFADLKDVAETLLTHLPNVDLINAFLCFMRLPPVPSLAIRLMHEEYSIDSFLFQAIYNSPSRDPASTADRCRKACIKHERGTPFSLFHNAFSNLHRGSDFEGDKTSAAMMFVDLTFQRILSVIGENDDLSEYYLAFVARLAPKKAIKTAKRLLKLHSSSLRMYNAYALIQAGQGLVNKAEEVWTTALKMSAKWPEEKREDTVLLIHSRTMTLVRCDQHIKALRYLIEPTRSLDAASVVNHKAIGAAERLKATRMLDQGFESMRATTMLRHAIFYADCMAWFSYLVNGNDLYAALEIYEKYIAKLSSMIGAFAFELLHQARAELLRMHIENKRPFKPIVVRGLLAESLRRFPGNSLFYDVQMLISAQTRVDDRLRNALADNSEQHQDIGLVSWYYAIAREIGRCNTDGSGTTPNSVRALFSQALLNNESQVKHSPYLWTLWFEFELLVADASGAQQKLRQVFFDGVRHLSWHKPWIIMGMHRLPKLSVESESEVRRLYDVMTEREMRIRAETEY